MFDNFYALSLGENINNSCRIKYKNDFFLKYKKIFEDFEGIGYHIF